MLRNKLYYDVKPLIPRRLRMEVRRHWAAMRRAKAREVWPIMPGSEKAPEGWPGWPDGKQFALVLTHDVETSEGLEKCRSLMDLESSLGFRSSFNFIPEDTYRVSEELRREMQQRGFEVGVHDLYHDGKLFRRRQDFRWHAVQINRHLANWGAVGFRSGFMLHNLEWLHDLNIEYDLSTFDTDPFEPEPYGKHTIFPFWVSRPTLNPQPLSAGGEGLGEVDSHSQGSTLNRTGYAELPYTLPQDSTLFLLLGERGPDIWLRKVDWIARHGGMALVNVHPDYLDFGGKATAEAYPVDFYAEFLKTLKERYAGCFWQALPSQVGAHVRSRPQISRAPAGNGKILHRNGRMKPKIWIDLDNTPHVPFFEPIIEELKSRGFPVLVTARDAFQVCDLAEKKGLACRKIGRHYGRNRLAKAAGLFYRALQLAPLIARERPGLAVSHGARSQLLLSNCRRTPTVLLADYEYCVFPPLMRPTWLMVPGVIPDAALQLKHCRIRKYPGIKEDVYAWKLGPDVGPIRQLGVGSGELVVTVRPPATEAHYHNPESEILFEAFMDRACALPATRIILLPRNRAQAESIRSHHPAWFKGDKTIIPQGALDGLNLIWHSDLVVSGGGTMNREAAALGVPVYSIFRGAIGAVDQHLAAEGRLVLIEAVADVEQRIRLAPRPKKPLAETTSKKTLQAIVDSIAEIAELENA